LVEYVEYAKANEFKRPGKLLKALEADPKRSCEERKLGSVLVATSLEIAGAIGSC
jgi:hypothetical protein